MILCRNPAVLAGYRKCAVSLTITETDVPREICEGINNANGWDQWWEGCNPALAFNQVMLHLMPKMAHAGEDHRYSQAVSGLDGLVVTYGAAWLNDGRDSGTCRLLYVVGEGE